MSTRQLKKNVYQSKNVEDKFFNLIFPQQALGSYVDDEASESGFILTVIILFLLICGIMSTLVYLNILPQGNVQQKTKNLILISSIFSWTLFLSFMFLLFSASRLLHIALLVGLLSVSSLSLKDLKSKDDKDMTLAIIIFASVTLAILFYYFTLSRTVTDSIEYREKERLVRLENKYKDRLERVRETSDENMKDIRREREILKKEYEKIEKERDELSKKLEKRKKERKFLQKKIEKLKDDKYDDSSDSSDSD